MLQRDTLLFTLYVLLQVGLEQRVLGMEYSHGLQPS